jgi:membrane-bound lytic murein transglycosylase A
VAAAFPFQKYLHPVSWDALPLVPPPPFSAATHDAFQVIGPDGDTGLFTGYYEPELRGSFTRGGAYQHPVYAFPTTAEPLPDRGAIMAGALDGSGLELLYTDDAVDLFFAHVQGSAAVRLPDGGVQRIGFAGKSGHPYTAIGKVLRERGLLQPPVTMQAIKAWLHAHPQRQAEIFSANASFIFFRLINGDGPVGAGGEVLQPEASLAVDEVFYPYGLDVILATDDPLTPGKPLIRLMKTHDKGSAIKGILRGDIYFGGGENAAQKAGAMQAKGRLYILREKN